MGKVELRTEAKFKLSAMKVVMVIMRSDLVLLPVGKPASQISTLAKEFDFFKLAWGKFEDVRITRIKGTYLRSSERIELKQSRNQDEGEIQSHRQ